jgi:replication factor A1
MEYYGEDSSRGRPRGHQSYSTISVLSSIAHIAAKYNLDPKLLLDTFTEAQTSKESQCATLKVECRKVDNDFAIFLITCNDKVVWQSPIKIEILQKPEFFKSCIPIISPRVPINREDDLTPKNICELKANMRCITVKAKIMEIPPRRLVSTRYGEEAYVSNILLADNTGTIRLSLWNGQIDDVSVGDTVNIEKAKVSTFYGELQLRIGRSGMMSVDTSTREPATI